MTKPLQIILMTGIACAFMQSAAADQATCTATSPPGRTALVELYTSEGCSSCPPADRWLTEQVSTWDPQKVVALAFHVDYWDRLGWTDRFAQEAFSIRQRDLARLKGSGVYTPQLLVSGHSLLLNAWPAAFNRQLDEITSQAAMADIQLKLTPETGMWRVEASGRVHPVAATGKLGLFLALYQDRLSSRVLAGENQGKELRHDRVVRKLVGPLAVAENGAFSHQVRFELPEDFEYQAASVLAFIQSAEEGEVLQALALQACAD